MKCLFFEKYLLMVLLYDLRYMLNAFPLKLVQENMHPSHLYWVPNHCHKFAYGPGSWQEVVYAHHQLKQYMMLLHLLEIPLILQEDFLQISFQ